MMGRGLRPVRSTSPPMLVMLIFLLAVSGLLSAPLMLLLLRLLFRLCRGVCTPSCGWSTPPGTHSLVGVLGRELLRGRKLPLAVAAPAGAAPLFASDGGLLCPLAVAVVVGGPTRGDGIAKRVMLQPRGVEGSLEAAGAGAVSLAAAA